jgi:hypothetical protein
MDKGSYSPARRQRASFLPANRPIPQADRECCWLLRLLQTSAQREVAA